MSDMRYAVDVYGKGRGSSGTYRAISGTKDGSIFAADHRLAAVMDGRGFHVSIGAFSTPITGGGAGTVLDLDQPEGVISVPSGTAIMPIRIHVQCQVPLLATDADESEILIAVDRTAAWNADGTNTAETAFNMRTDNPRSSNCSCASAFTADMTATTGADPVLGIELAHAVITGDVQGTPANALWTPLVSLYEPQTPPILVGPCALYVYWGGTVATTGFAQIQWLEFPSTDFAS